MKSFESSDAGTPRAPLSTLQYTDYLTGNTAAVTPPTPKEAEPIKVARIYKRGGDAKISRTPSPKDGNLSPQNGRSLTPQGQRSHSPFPMEDHKSPMTPVGETLYNGEYIRQPSPNGARPVQPAQVNK